MRVLQNVGIYPSYAKRLAGEVAGRRRYDEAMADFRQGGFEATHLLDGVLNGDKSCFLTIGNFGPAQALWAAEQGLPAGTPASELLLAQIEAHRAEVFYNLDPVRFDDRMLRRLPGCVKRSVAWSAAPSPHTNFQGYDLVVNNFPGILKQYRDLGCTTAYFFPAFDPAMADAAASQVRPIDILFVGGYSRHHQRRAAILEAVARLAPARSVRYHLDLGRLNRLAELPLLGRLGRLGRHRRTPAVRAVSAPALFGRELYHAIGQSKIVLNAAVDMAHDERGNIRCFESLGCGALLLSDAGTYPGGMAPGQTLATYTDASDALNQAARLLDDDALRGRISGAGHEMIVQRYSKARQWSAFVELVG